MLIHEFVFDIPAHFTSQGSVVVSVKKLAEKLGQKPFELMNNFNSIDSLIAKAQIERHEKLFAVFNPEMEMEERIDDAELALRLIEQKDVYISIQTAQMIVAAIQSGAKRIAIMPENVFIQSWDKTAPLLNSFTVFNKGGKQKYVTLAKSADDKPVAVSVFY